MLCITSERKLPYARCRYVTGRGGSLKRQDKRVEISKRSSPTVENDLPISTDTHSPIGQDHSLLRSCFFIPLGFFNSALEIVGGGGDNTYINTEKMHVTQRLMEETEPSSLWV